MIGYDSIVYDLDISRLVSLTKWHHCIGLMFKKGNKTRVRQVYW
jgi:hypothetical protein